MSATAQDIVLYDWLSFSSKASDPYYIVDILGLKKLPWQLTKGARGYRDRLYFNAISIHFNGREDMGIWCEMSGQGCRAFETLSTLEGDKWEALFNSIIAEKMNITRLDIACDDHSGMLDIDEIIQDTRNKEYVSKSDYWQIIESSKGQSLQFGSPQSDTLIRIYDKARERNCPEGEHWIRVELQLRRERAIAFSRLGFPLASAFAVSLLTISGLWILMNLIPTDGAGRLSNTGVIFSAMLIPSVYMRLPVLSTIMTAAKIMLLDKLVTQLTLISRSAALTASWKQSSIAPPCEIPSMTAW